MSEPEPIAPLPAGTRLHELRIQRPIGRGGAGIVYAAEHGILGGTFAVKEFLPARLARRADGNRVEPLPGQEALFAALKRKFLEEGQTLVQLAQPRPHPTIVQATDAFRANDTVYLCMSFERGESLQSLVDAGGPIAEQQLRGWLAALLDGLEHVHRHQVFHRDIKPSNILIRDDGSPVLIDFGAAHQRRPQGQISIVAQYTPDFAAPEQLLDGEQGPWTDLYCLAATCVYALTGQSLSRGTLSPAARQLLDACEPRFVQGLEAALRQDPRQRPPQVQAWRALLGYALDTPGAPRSTPADAQDAATRVCAAATLPASVAGMVSESVAGSVAPLAAAPVAGSGGGCGAGSAARSVAGSVADAAVTPTAAGLVPAPESAATQPPRAPSDGRGLRILALAGVTAGLVGGLSFALWLAPRPLVPSGADMAVDPAGRLPAATPGVGTGAATGTDSDAAPAQSPTAQAAAALDRPPVSARKPALDLPALVERLTSELDCAAVTLASLPSATQPSAVRLVGHVRDQQQLTWLTEQLARQAPGTGVDTAEVALATPFCAQMAAFDAAMARLPDHPEMPRLQLDRPDRGYHEGDYLVLRVTNVGSTAGFLYLQLVDRAGALVPLLPNPDLPDNFLAPGQSLRIGARDARECEQMPDACFIASRPHGNHLILALWSARPLGQSAVADAAAGGWQSLTDVVGALEREATAIGGGGVNHGYRFLTTMP